MNICLTWWRGASAFFFLLYYPCSASTITHFPLLSSQLIPQHWTALMNYLTLFPPFSSDNPALWKFQGASADKQKYQYLNKLHILSTTLFHFSLWISLIPWREREGGGSCFLFFFFKALSPGALKEEFRTQRFIMRELRWVTSEGGIRVDLMKFTSFQLQKHRLRLFYPSTLVLCLPLKERKTA